MSDRIYNIMHNTYIEYCEMLQFTYYSAVKSIYYFDKVVVYDIQKRILKDYHDILSYQYLTLIDYDHKKKCWFNYIRYPINEHPMPKYNICGMHCLVTWKSYVNKHLLLRSELRKCDPYISFRINKFDKWAVFTDEDKKELLKFTKKQRNFIYSIIVLYVKRIVGVRDIKYKILTYLFSKRNFRTISRIMEVSKKADVKYIEGFFNN